MWPQITILFICFVSLLVYAYGHGKPKGKINFWIKLCDVAIILGLLYMGGFFDILLKH